MTDGLFHPPRNTAACALTSKRPHPDNDRLLVLTLAVILVQNHASLELILALLYIAM